MLITIRGDLEDWGGTGNGVKVIKKLYMTIAKGLKDTPLNTGPVRWYVWYQLERQVKKPEFGPYIDTTIKQIKRDLQGYKG